MALSAFNAEPLKSLAAASIVAGYTAIGAPFGNPVAKLYVTNLTDAAVLFSLDGIIDHFVLPSQGFLVIDVSVENGNENYIATGTSIYVKQLGVPSVGSVYVSSFFGVTR